MSFVELTREGVIGVIRLNRPERLNAISTTLTEDFHKVLFDASRDDAIRTIVLTGAGRAFCAGDDLQEFDQQTASPEATVHHIENIQRITRDMMFMDKLIIGAVHGFAVGGGFEWLLNCDMVVASEDLIAFFPEMEWGQFVTGGVTWLLPQAVGYQKAMELMVLGERQNADALKSMGLVNWVVPTDETFGKAMEVAELVASKGRFSTASLKQMLTTGISGDLVRALDLEEKVTISAFETDEAMERSANFPINKK